MRKSKFWAPALKSRAVQPEASVLWTQEVKLSRLEPNSVGWPVLHDQPTGSSLGEVKNEAPRGLGGCASAQGRGSVSVMKP